MFQVGRKAAELERVKLQMEIQKEKSEIRRKKLEKWLKMAGKAGRSGPAKNPKKMKTKQEQDDDDLLDDLVLETDLDKRQMSYSMLEPGGFVTKGADRKTWLDQRQVRIVAAAGEPDDNGDKEETEQERLECEANKLSSQLKKAERAEAQVHDKDQWDKAKWYSQRITGGRFLKQPKAITLVETKKRKKSMKMGDIASAEEEDKPDDIPEGFHLHEQSPHCINMTRADDYQAYLWQKVIEFEHLIKSGATSVRQNYSKVIQSMFWPVKANKQTILNGADPDEVLASIPDLKCRAWQMKLNGKTAVDPGMLIDDMEIGPQTASEMMKMKPQEVLELVEEELVRKTKEQINAIKKCIGNVCREQALAHRHVADNLVTLTEMVSLPILVKVISATMRSTVAIKIRRLTEARAQEKVDAIKQAKQKVGELQPIDEVVFAQNVPKYNLEWEHSPNGRATSYLATLVCWYMHELQQKDKKVVLSAKALETIYHTASSSIGKLISSKQYLGG